MDLLASNHLGRAMHGSIYDAAGGYEGRFAAQASKEPLDQRSKGSFRSTSVKKFRREAIRASGSEQFNPDRAPPLGGGVSGGALSSASADGDGGLGAIRASGSEQSNPDRAPPH